MTLQQFAKDAGVTVGRCEPSWGGTWSYKCVDTPHCTFAGYKTEQAAYKAWLKETFGAATSKAILKLIKKANR